MKNITRMFANRNRKERSIGKGSRTSKSRQLYHCNKCVYAYWKLGLLLNCGHYLHIKNKTKRIILDRLLVGYDMKE